MPNENNAKIAEENLARNAEMNIVESTDKNADDEVIDLITPCSSVCSSPRLVICESPEPELAPVPGPRISVRKDLFEKTSSPNDGQIPGTSWRNEKIYDDIWIPSIPLNSIPGNNMKNNDYTHFM